MPKLTLKIQQSTRFRMTTNDTQSKVITDVVINIGYGSFSLTDTMCTNLGILDKHPSMKELPRHDKKLVELVRAGHGRVKQGGKHTGLVIREIAGNKYRIFDYDGHEWIETPDTIKWTVVPDDVTIGIVHPSQAHRVLDDGWVD